MTTKSIRPSKVTLLNVCDETYNLRNKPDKYLLISYLFASVFTLGAPLFVMLVYNTLKYTFKSSQVRVLRRLDAATCCYQWSLRNAIKCQHVEGVVYILKNTLGELRKTSIPLTGPYKYNGNKWGIPDIARLESALTLAIETRDRSDEIRHLAGETGLIQSIEVIKNMIRGEDISFRYEEVSAMARDEWNWFDWTDSDQREYIASHRQQITRDISTQTTNQTRTPIPSTSEQFSVLSLDQFTSTHLASFEKYQQINPSLQYLSEDEQLRTYKAYQKSEYQRYLDRVGFGKLSPVEIRNDHPTTPQRNSDLDIW